MTGSNGEWGSGRRGKPWEDEIAALQLILTLRVLSGSLACSYWAVLVRGCFQPFFSCKPGVLPHDYLHSSHTSVQYGGNKCLLRGTPCTNAEMLDVVLHIFDTQRGWGTEPWHAHICSTSGIAQLRCSRGIPRICGRYLQSIDPFLKFQIQPVILQKQ